MKRLFEMIHNTFNLNPLPRRSVKFIAIPPEIDFKILVVAGATFGFLIFAPTAIPINGAAILTAEIKNLSQNV